jgi:riboflavin kinase / FMN adenylyltransferase
MGQDVIALGTFDGVHRGHQSVLAAARRCADQACGRCVAYTFDVPPRATAGGASARLLLSPATKRRLLGAWADRVVEAPFHDVRNLAPEQFVSRVLVRDLDAKAVVVGSSFRFGKDRSGDVSLLGRLAQDVGIELVLVPPLCVGGEAVSSTRIRTLLESGNVGEARELLGRPPLFRGRVVPGDAIGRTLGFPTANLDLDPRILRPLDGIYLSRAYYDAVQSLALTYCGRRPTLGGTSARCEVHLLEPPSKDLQGTTLEVHLYSLLRPDRAFPTPAALREQMQKDLEEARRAAPLLPEAMDPGPFGG